MKKMHKLNWVQNFKIPPGRDTTDHIPSQFIFFPLTSDQPYISSRFELKLAYLKLPNRTNRPIKIRFEKRNITYCFFHALQYCVYMSLHKIVK